MGGTNLRCLDDGQIVDAAESSTHGCSESRCAEGHAAEEPRLQLVMPACRHQGGHLGSGPAVLSANTGHAHSSHSQLGLQLTHISALTNLFIIF